MEETKEEIIINPADQDTANDDERTLIEKHIVLQKELEDLEIALKAKKKEFDSVEANLEKLLEDDGKDASAKYEGLGYVVRMVGANHASIEKGRQPEVLSFLRENGRDDMIKEIVASATLSTYVRECLKRNEPVPPGVTYYAPSYLRFYPSKV